MNYLSKYNLFEGKNESNFEKLVGESLLDLIDQGFYYTVMSSKSTFYISIRYKGVVKTRRAYGQDEEYTDTSFKWGTVKESIEVMVNYLKDIYPKITFTEFRIIPNVYYIGHGIFYLFDEFLNSMNDYDKIQEVKLQCTLRFRGNIKPF